MRTHKKHNRWFWRLHRLLAAAFLAICLALLPGAFATAQIDPPDLDSSRYDDTYYQDEFYEPYGEFYEPYQEDHEPYGDFYETLDDEDYEPYEDYDPEAGQVYDYDELGYDDEQAPDDALSEVDVDHFRSGAYIYDEDFLDAEIYGDALDTGFYDRPYLGVEPYDQDIREGTPFWRYENYYDTYYDVTDEAFVDEEQIYSNTQEYLIESNDYGWFFNEATDAWEFGYHDQDQLYDDYQFDEFNEFVGEE